jgi:hypothetical protein
LLRRNRKPAIHHFVREVPCAPIGQLRLASPELGNIIQRFQAVRLAFSTRARSAERRFFAATHTQLLVSAEKKGAVTFRQTLASEAWLD